MENYENENMNVFSEQGASSDTAEFPATAQTEPQTTAGYEDVYSQSAPPSDTAPYDQQQGSYTDPYYAEGYYTYGTQAPFNVDVYAPKKEKKSSKGKTAAITFGVVALALCVGLGGGVLGAYVAGGNLSQPTESSSVQSVDSSPALQIVQASDTETAPTTTQEVAAKVKDSVVEITTETTQYDTFYGQYVAQAAGSGVIISSDGYIITNNHVIEDAQTITVRLTNQKTYQAKLIGKDATLDVALLKIEEKDLTTATFGDSASLSVGQTAIAIGNPLGSLGGTVTDGIISALDREIKIDGKTMNLLQTNAAINPGNSGGGLFDANGNLIGIVVAKSSSTSSGTSVEGLGFAIPVNDIVDVLGDLKSKGYVTGRPYLGVNLVNITSQSDLFMYRVDKLGVYISAVTAGSAADKGGLQVGDCVTKLNDDEVSSATDLKAALSKYKAGDTVKITVYRNGETLTKSVTLDEAPNQEESSSSPRTERISPYSGFGGSFGTDGY